MTTPALGLSKRPSLTQDREKLQKDQVKSQLERKIYWFFIESNSIWEARQYSEILIYNWKNLLCFFNRFTNQILLEKFRS